MASLTVGWNSDKTTNQRDYGRIMLFLPMTAVIYESLEAKDVPANSRDCGCWLGLTAGVKI